MPMQDRPRSNWNYAATPAGWRVQCRLCGLNINGHWATRAEAERAVGGDALLHARYEDRQRQVCAPRRTRLRSSGG